MLSRTIETLKYLLSEYRFYFLIITLLLALLAYTRYQILITEKELVRMKKEHLLHQITFEKKQKEHYEEVKLQQAELERMLKEIKSHK